MTPTQRADGAATVSFLTEARRAWMREALALVAPGHHWIERIERIERTNRTERL